MPNTNTVTEPLLETPAAGPAKKMCTPRNIFIAILIALIIGFGLRHFGIIKFSKTEEME